MGESKIGSSRAFEVNDQVTSLCFHLGKVLHKESISEKDELSQVLTANMKAQVSHTD